MKKPDELITLVCNRLKISDPLQKECVTKILYNAFALSEHHKPGLNQVRVIKLFALINGFISEIKLITDDPLRYDDKLKEIKNLLKLRTNNEYDRQIKARV